MSAAASLPLRDVQLPPSPPWRPRDRSNSVTR
jgi:hypothetical protein